MREERAHPVFHRVEAEPPPGLQHSEANVVDGCYSNDKAIPARARRAGLGSGGSSERAIRRLKCSTHCPVHVPSTSVKSFFLTVSRRLGPK